MLFRNTLLPIAVLFAAAACSPGDAEKAGERADSAIEEGTGGQKDLTDGPLENAGEAVDRVNSDISEGVQNVAPPAEDGTKDPKK
jgi:hypothetical protein